MQYLFLALVLTLTSLNLKAQEVNAVENIYGMHEYFDLMDEVPDIVCDDVMNNCSREMREITHKFQMAGNVSNLKDPGLYTGDCYHLARYHNPARLQYGVVFLDTHSEHFPIEFMGRFAFHYPENPYTDFTIEYARQEMPSTSRYKAEDKGDHVLVDIGARYDTIFRYYFRQDEQTGNLLVYGLWSVDHRLYCEMRKL